MSNVDAGMLVKIIIVTVVVLLLGMYFVMGKEDNIKMP